MKTFFSFPCKFRRLVSNKKPPRQKPLPSDWHYMVWEGNFVIMNHRPVWNHKVSELMDVKLYQLILDKIVENDKLPTIDELKEGLRNEKLKDHVRSIFLDKAGREMHEVDYEIGLQHAFSFISEPIFYDVPGLARKIRKGTETGGGIIQKYYSADYAK